MILGEEVLLGTLIKMVPTVFEKNDVKCKAICKVQNEHTFV